MPVGVAKNNSFAVSKQRQQPQPLITLPPEPFNFSFSSTVSSWFESAKSEETHGNQLSSPVSNQLSNSVKKIYSSLHPFTLSPLHPFTSSAFMLFAQPTSANVAPFDFDGDGRSDVSRWRGVTGEWSVIKSSDGNSQIQMLGSQTDLIAPEDYDGDNKTDYAVFTPSSGVWTIRQSSNSTNVSHTLGQSGDIPVSADYDGDSKADVAVWRPSNGTWYYRSSINSSIVSTTFGTSGDIPAQANYDGDSKADFAVFRPSDGYWYILRSSDSVTQYLQWGLNGDIPVAGDYDGDSKADVAIFRPSSGTWWCLKSSDNNNSWITRTWGNYGDQPVPARYDSDNKTDFAVWRPSTGVWYIVNSSDNSYTYKTHGINSDVSVPSAFLKKTGFAVPAYEMAKERLDPSNRTSGSEYIYSRNIGWGTSLFGLSGRSGLGAGVGLSYNSLIWTKLNNAVYFDVDNSNLSPGFRFGYPVIEPYYYNNETGRNSFLLVSPSGSRTEFRQIAATNFYESADSSYTQLKVKSAVNPNNPEEQGMTLQLTDGTQMSYEWKAGAYRCTQIKDSNGNFITVFHDDNGLLKTVTDTLGRIITFNYDEQLYLTSITQPWEDGNGNATTRTWASFTYENSPSINTNFGSMTVYGPANGTTLRVLSKVTMADESYEKFYYNSYGQVFKIESHAKDNHILNYTSYDIDTSQTQTDCPRFTKRRDWAENFNAGAEVITEFSVLENQSYTIDGATENNLTIYQVKTADGTTNGIVTKIFSRNSGWEESLPLLVETWATENNVFDKRRWVTTKYEQDKVNGQSVTYLNNPRVIETKIQDTANTKRATISYYKQPSDENISRYGLVKDVIEYDPTTNTQYRRSHTEYNFDSAYTDRRIIGLPTERTLYGYNPSEQLMSKATFAYDEGNFNDTTLSQNIQPVQHDYTNYGSSFIIGRGNLTSTTRHDVTGSTSAVTSQIKYNTAGSVVATTNPLGITTTKISYADSFKDGNNTRNTFAYPTKITYPAINPTQLSDDDNSTTATYVFHYGAVWKTNGIKPLNQTIGANTTNTFDSKGRLLRTTLDNNGSYTRYFYSDAQNYVETYSTITEGQGETYSATFFDGHGRVRISISDLPNAPSSTPTNPAYSAVLTEYDILGRVKRQTTPTEVNFINNQYQPAGDDAANMPGRSADGWLWTSAEYDWKGRVTKSINTDGTFKTISYQGCGCAGGETTTIQGEQLTEGRRTQKIYGDPFGRTYKTEILNWDNSVYSTAITTFDALDRATNIKEYQGQESSGVFQETTVTYDGHGRLKTRHVPIQSNGMVTTYNYNANDSLQSMIDARGVTTNYLYNNRGMITDVNFQLPQNPNPPITDTFPIHYDYGAVGNRTYMSDGTGNTSYQYNQLSQLTSETKTFSGITSRTFTISYGYNLTGQLTSIIDPFNVQTGYQFDKIGRLTKVTGSGLGVNEYISQVDYRSWGATKRVLYGNQLNVKWTYDNQLQVTRYEGLQGSSVKFGANYQYYDDGSTKYSQDLTDNRMDRSYKYDHATRLIEAKSGAEARGEPNTDNRPYRQT